ncbi:MAG: hypothetical protein KAT28_05580 [Candidatus Aenigmarchaeota archaeon]|nr:hypothetical protein [Candidatus Aenigmarchaeota archaeon]
MVKLYKGLENKYLLEIILLAICLGIIAWSIIGTQIGYVAPFQGNITLRSSCDMWDCEEPIPQDIQKGFNCATVSGCKQECRNIGSSQLLCKK